MGEGDFLGIKLKYKVQPNPNGLAEVFILGEDFIGKDSVALILGDNIFYGQGLTLMLQNADTQKNAATVFCYKVKDPKRFGVVELDQEKKSNKYSRKTNRTKIKFSRNWTLFL